MKAMMKTNETAPRTGLSAVLWSFRREFMVVGVFSMVVNLLMLTPTLYMLQVFDRVMLSQSLTTLTVLSLLTLFLFGVMAFAEWARSLLLVRTGVRLDQALSQRVFKASFLSYLNPADTAPAKAFTDLTVLRQFMTGNGVFAFFDMPWIPIYLGVLFLLHPWLGVVAILFALVQGGIALFGHNVSKQAQLQAGQAQSQAQNFLQSKLRNVEVLSAMGMLGSLYQRWLVKQRQALTLSGQAQQHSGLPVLLFVGRADGGPFLVAEQGQVDRPGDVPLAEFTRAAHIQQGTLALEIGRHGHRSPVLLRHGAQGCN